MYNLQGKHHSSNRVISTKNMQCLNNNYRIAIQNHRDKDNYLKL